MVNIQTPVNKKDFKVLDKKKSLLSDTLKS